MTPARFLCWKATQDAGPPLRSDCAISGYRTISLDSACRLFVGEETCCLVDAERRTALVGVAFDREGRRVERLDIPPDTDDAGIARWLFTHFWGSFVVVRSAGRATTIMRDPSATMPCYTVRLKGRLFVGSHIRDVMAIARYSPTIDWPIVVRHLRAIQYRDAATALAGVSELLPGWSLDLEGASYPSWTPWSFAQRDRFIRDRGTATEALRQTVLLVTRAWASQFHHGVVSLSGGLDSSLLAAGLAAGDLPCTAVTLLSGTASGDEQRYAKTVAAHLGIPLEVRRLLDTDIDIAVSDAAHLPRPTARMFWQGADRILRDVAASKDADGHFHGGGGDNVFCFLQSVAPILDRIDMEGLSRNAWTTLRDICTLTGSDLGDAVVRTMRRRLSGRRSYRWAVDDSLLGARALEGQPPAFTHPWLVLPPGGLAGSAAHIALLLAIQNYLEGYRRELTVPVIAPLLAQPLVELCLRIPSWMWCQGGRNRSIARDAFADLLPREILTRRSKGTPDGYSMAIYERHRVEIRAFLHEGALARQGLLDLPAIDRIVTQEGPVRGHGYARILSLCDVEAWLRSWL